jgi:hypothetical protein
LNIFLAVAGGDDDVSARFIGGRWRIGGWDFGCGRGRRKLSGSCSKGRP